jgi:peptide/nickel transport system substrate-binding protein
VPTYVGAIFEKKFQDEHKEDMGKPGTLIMGTGAWKFDSLDPTRGVEMSAFDGYWGGKPQIRRISVKFFSDEQSVALAFRAGQVDVAFPEDVRAFSATSGAKVLSVPNCAQGFFAMNTKSTPFADVHVRRAVAYAVNRRDVIAAAGASYQPDYTMIPPIQLRSIASKAQVDALIKSLPKYEFNLAKARQELAKSAYPNGFTADFNTVQYGSYVIAAQAIAGNLAKIGINLKVNVLSLGDYIGYFFSGPKEKVTVLYSYYICQSPDPGYIPFFVYDGKKAETPGLNQARYSNAEVTKQIEIGRRVTDPAKRFAAYSKILRIVANDVPYLPLFTQTANVALTSRFTWPTFNAYSRFNVPWTTEIKVK